MSVDEQAPATGARVVITGTVQHQAWRDRVLLSADVGRAGAAGCVVRAKAVPRQPAALRARVPAGDRHGPVLVDTGWLKDEA